MDTVRWGILGTGSIARQQAAAINLATGAVLGAVGSRSLEKAKAFADEFGAARAYGSYEELAADPEIDAIYVASPHSGHRDHTLLALNAGKAVLCEKPFAINRSQAEEMVGLARSKGLFLMEAMWTRFFPAMVQVRKWLADEAIGQVRVITADFGFRSTFNPNSRLYDPELGGGAMLDVGIYPISFASMAMGSPDSFVSLMQPAPTHVDEQSAFILSSGLTLAVLYTSVGTTTPWEAVILGENGRIRVPSPFWKPSQAILEVSGSDPVVYDAAYSGNGYQYQIEEVGRCLREGQTESSVMPLDESLAIMGTMDGIRAQWGLKYPME